MIVACLSSSFTLFQVKDKVSEIFKSLLVYVFHEGFNVGFGILRLINLSWIVHV